MVGVEKVESECCFRTIKRCGVPVHTKELPVVLMGHSTRAAFAKSDLYFMPTVDVDDGKLMMRGFRGTHVAAMPKVADIPERMERGSAKEAILPALGVVSIMTRGRKCERTSRRCNGNIVCDFRIHPLQ